jgi:cyclopropane fatty-acyl-phospholipid synthase-like methyltransferase
LAEFKAYIINEFCKREDISTVIEFGCGDGNQLTYFDFPMYVGFDISIHAISMCKKRIAGNKKEFKLMNEYSNEMVDLVLSLDVIYHLIEDDTYENYMSLLFNASNKFVIIYASNYDEFVYYPDGQISHVRHRKFTNWIEKNASNFSS